MIGAGADAASLLGSLVARAPATPGLQGVCLALARASRERGDASTARTLLELVIATWPVSTDADKARLLLADST
jgi:TolA-binding protein